MAWWALSLPAACPAQDGATAAVVITGSVVQRTADEAPYAITVVDRDALRLGGPMVNLSEALVRVPGLVVNNRSNFAQDLQISARGYGARAGFGVRGIRLLVDGVPANGPDGQGQVSHFDIAGAQRVEVLRGPFSALYGNSSGGVIALFSAPATRRAWQADLDAGSFGLVQGRVGLTLPMAGGFDLQARLSQTDYQGFRPHSEARKRQAHVRVGWRGTNDTVTVLVNGLDQPAQDPLGLTRAQLDLGPDETAPQALDFNTRKSTRQSQPGASWVHRFDDGALRDSRVAAYVGRRFVIQWLAIPAGAQGNPRHGGGVVDLDRSYRGVDARLRWSWSTFDLVAGAAWDRQGDDRQGFENFLGTGASQVFGVTGRLRRDEASRADSRDLYAQGEWALSPTVSASGGVRTGRLEQSARDRYLSNGDDSGGQSSRYTTPVLGLRWQVARGLQLYASAARGFESPTLGELAYRIDGTGGFNTGLRPQRSRQFDLGGKWRRQAWSIDATVFQARTSDEIAVAVNSGGRSAFQNIGPTLRRGVEIAVAWRPSGPWHVQMALGSLDASYRSDFLACDGTPCTAPTAPVPAGNQIAGAPRASAWTEVGYAGGAWGDWALELRGVSRVPVNDRNSDFAPGFALASLRWSKPYVFNGGLRLEWLLRLDNLANRAYSGSVIVNEGNGRFFEPGAPRSLLVGLRLAGDL
jgi:iron complex outermembrane recepter protein